MDMRRSEKELKLSAARVCAVLHYDPMTGVFTRRVAGHGPHAAVGDVAGSVNKKGYRMIMVDGHSHMAHRLAWVYMTGEWPSGELDHDSNVGDENGWRNLRPATRAQNMHNIGVAKNNTSGVKGIVWDRDHKKWRARVGLDGKRVSVGRFECIGAAACARAVAVDRLHGEFGRVS